MGVVIVAGTLNISITMGVSGILEGLKTATVITVDSENGYIYNGIVYKK